MKIIVPLQGVVQGTGGLFWGSVIPCALFYFLQLYFKTRNRQSPPSNNLPPPELPALSRTLSPRIRGSTASANISGRVNSIITTNSPYYVGLNKVADNPYHRIHNPDGVIQLGLAQNTVSCSFSLLYWQFRCSTCVWVLVIIFNFHLCPRVNIMSGIGVCRCFMASLMLFSKLQLHLWLFLFVVAMCGFDWRMDSSQWKRCYIRDTIKLWLPQYHWPCYLPWIHGLQSGG